MLAVDCAAGLVFCVHDPLDCREIAFAQRVILIAEQTLPASPVLDGFDPDVHHLAAYERFDPFSSVPCKQSQPVHAVRAVINAESRKWHIIAYHGESSHCRRWFDEMPVIAYRIGAILRHQPGACKPGEDSHWSTCAALSVWRALRSKASRTGPCGSLCASSLRRLASSMRRSSNGSLVWLGLMRVMGSPNRRRERNTLSHR